MLRNPVPEPTVLGVHGLRDVDREAKEDRQTDGQTPGRLTRVGSLLGPSTEAVGPGVPLHGRELRLEFWVQNTPNIISCEQGESLPTLCLCEWGKALTLQTHRMVALEKRGRMKRGKQVFFQFYLKKKKRQKTAVTAPVCEGRGPTCGLAGLQAPRPRRGGPSLGRRSL